MKALHGFVRVWDRLIEGIMVLAGILLWGQMVIVNIEIFSRYFCRPTIWVAEISSILILWIPFMMPRLGLAERRPREDGPAAGASQPRTQALINFITSLIGVIVMFIVTVAGSHDDPLLDRKQDAHDVDVAQVADHRHHFCGKPFVRDTIFHQRHDLSGGMENGEGQERMDPGKLECINSRAWKGGVNSHGMADLACVIFGILLVLMVTGMPIALCFFVINVIGMYFLFGGIMGLQNLINSLYNSLNSFILLPIPLFILMGEVMFQSKIAPTLIPVIGKWMGRLPGRLALLAVASGTLFSTLTGTSIASVAMLGSTLVPEMEAQNYKKPMSLGPIMGSGGLAMLIPPSALAVLCGAIGEISISRILIGIIIPGLLVAAIMAAYIIYQV